jgi:Domain of unknown function (DUF4349)
MNTKTFYPALLISSLFFSCHSSKEKDQLAKADIVMAPIENIASLESEKEKKQIPTRKTQILTTDSSATQTPLKPADHTDWDKKIIKTATLKLEVKDFENYNGSVHKTVKQFGGYIAQEEQNLSEEKTETTISIKVPVDQFETMMNQLPGGDVKILERKITTEDVTGEVVDVKSRLQTKMQMRLKYLDFLKQSKNMEEVLQVQNEINEIQEAIEAAAGRVEYLTHQSAMSTINLSFYQPINGYKPSDGTPSFLTRVTDAFKTGGTWLADLLVGMISLWPLLIISIIGVFIFKKKFSTKKQAA